jgi:hypothetical protein
MEGMRTKAMGMITTTMMRITPANHPIEYGYFRVFLL